MELRRESAPGAVRDRWLSAVAWSGCGAVAVYVLATVLGGILDSSYSHLRHPVSQLISSQAPDRWLLGGFFVAYNLALLLFGLGLYRTGRRGGALRAAFAVIGVIAVAGILMVAPFPQDSLGEPGTATGAAHIALGYAVAPLTVAAALLLGFAFRREPSGRGGSRFSFAMGFVILGTGAITAISHGSGSPLLGLFERLTIGAFLVWVVGMAAYAPVGVRGGNEVAMR